MIVETGKGHDFIYPLLELLSCFPARSEVRMEALLINEAIRIIKLVTPNHGQLLNQVGVDILLGHPCLID